MANYGAAIQKLRKEKGYTQSELGNMLSVSAQAVSKWENNFSQPDLDTIQELAGVFDITVDDFMRLSNGEDISDVQKEAAATEETATVYEPVADSKVSDDVGASNGDTGVTVSSGAELTQNKKTTPNYYDSIKQTESGKKSKVKIDGWRLFGLICAAVLGIACMITLICMKENVFLSILSGYGLFALIASIGHDCWADDVFLWAWDKSIHMPGIIFSLDFNGIVFMLVYKFIIAPIVSFIISVLLGILGSIIAMFVAIVSYPFFAPRLFRETFLGEDQV